MSTAEENRTLGGYKAALHNPNTSDSAKHHAAELLKAHGALDKSDEKFLQHKPKEAAHHHHNLNEHHVRHEDYKRDEVIADNGQGSEHDHRVLGGYKATLENPKASAEAKDRAAEILTEHGVKF